VNHKEKADAWAKPLTGPRRSTSGPRRRSLISIIRAWRRFFKKSDLFWFWQATSQQGSLTCPGSPLPGGAGLGFLIARAIKYLGSDDVVCPKFKKITFQQKFLVLCRRREDSASRIETFGDFSRAGGPKNLFCIALAKAAA
jgi:hypothetical protein